MNRDPFGVWTSVRCTRWVALAAMIGLVFGPRFVRSLTPPRGQILDFYQEWSSAKNITTGLPVYAPLDVTVERYLHMQKSPGTEWYWDVNVHPPTSVLLALPLVTLEYQQATLAWNVVSLLALALSLIIVIRTLGIQFSPWSTLPIVGLLLVCDPLLQQVIQGQLNLILLLLITIVWAADRSGRYRLAGITLGFATAVKLFPGFLFVYFLLRRKWQPLFVGALAFLVITLATLAIVGVDTYHMYIAKILPQAATWKAAWNNASLPGLWHKLFDPVSRNGELTALMESPAAAKVFTLASWLIVLACLAPVVWRARTLRQRDLSFAATVTAMLLVSPVTWEHYFLLLLVPLAVNWVWVERTPVARLLQTLIVIALFLPVILLGNLFIPGGFFNGQATPWHTLTLFSFQCYALLALFGMSVSASYITEEQTISEDDRWEHTEQPSSQPEYASTNEPVAVPH